MNKEYLDALKDLREFVIYCRKSNEDVGIIEKALTRLESIDNAEVGLKALEIIKEKPQAELSLIQLGKIKTYEEYLKYTEQWELDLYSDMVYTEEEFNLLKEAL